MTIKEIAEMAGVSSAAVSRYLNDGYISQEKKDVIRRVIEETGYQPSAHAQMLRTKKTKLIGVVLPKINSNSTSRTVAGIHKVLSENGFQILLADTENNINKELDYLQLFQNHQVDGIIFIATILTREHKRLLREASLPIVVIGQQLKEASCIYHNDYEAAREVSRLLLSKKRTAAACLHVTLKDKAAGENRLNGFLSAAKELGYSQSGLFLMECGFTMEDARVKAKTLYESHPEIDALFCATDTIAVGAVLTLKEAGVSVPETVAVTGIGNTEMSRILSPALTTVHYYYMSSGMEAAKMILSLLEEREPLHREIQLGYRLEKRQSV